MGKDNTDKGDKGDMGNEGNDGGDGGFEGYTTDTESPGMYLLVLTFMYCLACLAIVLWRPNKTAELNRKEKEEEEEDITANTRRGLHGKKKFGGNFTKLLGKKKKEGKKPNRSRVQISQGLGKQNKDIESNVNTKEGFSALDDDSRLEYDDLIPMWDKLGRTRDIKNDPQPNQEKGQSEFGGVFGCFKARRIFSNRNHDGEKKPFLGSKEKKRPLLENDSRSKNNGDASVSTRSTQSTQSTEDSEDEIVIKNEMKEVFKLAGP